LQVLNKENHGGEFLNLRRKERGESAEKSWKCGKKNVIRVIFHVRKAPVEPFGGSKRKENTIIWKPG